MNWDRIEGNWKQMKGSIKEKWGKLTDDEFDMIAGKLNGQMAFMTGKLKLKGDMGLAMNVGGMFQV